MPIARQLAIAVAEIIYNPRLGFLKEKQFKIVITSDFEKKLSIE